MMNLFRDIRLLPVVLAAAGSLLVLKVAGLVIDGGYVLQFDAPATAPAKTSANVSAKPPGRPELSQTARALWTVNGKNAANDDITGSTAAAPPAEGGGHGGGGHGSPPPAADKEGGATIVKPADLKVSDKKPPDVATPETRAVPPAERAVLERLQERREELDARAREIEIRENLLKESERRAQTRADEAKPADSPEETAQKRDEADKLRLKNLVIMYENMKAKDAARIFDRLDIKLLVQVAAQINPRRMSDILAQMQSETAEKLTVELAGRSTVASAPVAAELPKIEGRKP